MAQVKLLKIDSDGVPVEMNQTSDDITLNSFTIQGGGPVLSSTGLELNNTNISEIDDLSFNDATSTITSAAGTFDAEDLMFDSKENVMESGSAILFPTITDDVDQVDSFRLPALAGTPTAAPADGGEGYLVWDSTNDKLYAWNGSAWDDLSTVQTAQNVRNQYIADENLTANDLVYISASNNVSKVDVSGSGAPSRAIGFAVSTVLDTANVDVQSEGVLSGFSGLTVGARYYADPATPGAITATLPNSSGNTIVQVGYAKSATELHIHIEQLGRRS